MVQRFAGTFSFQAQISPACLYKTAVQQTIVRAGHGTAEDQVTTLNILPPSGCCQKQQVICIDANCWSFEKGN